MREASVKEDKVVIEQPADSKALIIVDIDLARTKNIGKEKPYITTSRRGEALSRSSTNEDAPAPSPEKGTGGSVNRGSALAQVETDKKNSLIKAWEESQKSKAENKARKKMSSISSWENSKQASIEAEMKKLEEALEKKKAQYAEKINNKIAMIHKAAEERRAMVEAKRVEDLLKVEEEAAKYRATGDIPKKGNGCFSS